MASRSEEDFYCPVCKDVFRNPVVLSCSHSFCKDCLKHWWRQKPTRECPVCKTNSSKREPPCNLVLKNLCEAFLLERDQRSSEDLCSLHAEKLKLFCLDHQESVCLICRDSEKHSEHRFRPIDEAARQLKKNLQDTLQPLKEKLKVLKEVKVKFDQTLEHIEVQAGLTEGQIKEQFKKLHHFLFDEEEARLRALREEERQKIKKTEKEMEPLSKEIVALSNTVRDTENQLKTGDLSFLKIYKAAVERVQQRTLLEAPPLPTGTLIDQAKHLGNLGFNIWNKMKDMISYTPIVLDPNTAGPELILSDDLTSVRAEEKQKVPGDPQRSYEASWIILGSEGLNSGTQSWDFEVGDSEGWGLGVTAESTKAHAKAKVWGINLSNKQYKAVSPIPPSVVLPVKNKLKKIRVNLDCDGGKLTFTDLHTHEQIHTINQTFTERMFPVVGTLDRLQILPYRVCVTQQLSDDI